MKWVTLFLPFLLFAGVPDTLLFGVGAYDFYRPKHRTTEFDLEYRFQTPPLYRWLILRPVLGAMASVRGSGYLYGGINFDLRVGSLFVVPGFAAGYYFRGRGKDLGYALEFRSGVEVAWQFPDYRRLGIHFYHLSNAHLGHKNPGEESLVFFYDIPIDKLFPIRN